MKKKVEEELNQLHSAKLIESVAYSQWAAPVVPILKSDGTVHIYGNCKITVNRYAHFKLYPLPTPEDLVATLAGGVMFSKLAYQQFTSDDDSNH